MITTIVRGTVDRVSSPKGKGDSGYVTVTFHGGTSNVPFDVEIFDKLKRLEYKEADVCFLLQGRNTVEFGRSESWFKPVKVISVEPVKA